MVFHFRAIAAFQGSHYCLGRPCSYECSALHHSSSICYREYYRHIRAFVGGVPGKVDARLRALYLAAQLLLQQLIVVCVEFHHIAPAYGAAHALVSMCGKIHLFYVHIGRRCGVPFHIRLHILQAALKVAAQQFIHIHKYTHGVPWEAEVHGAAPRSLCHTRAVSCAQKTIGQSLVRLCKCESVGHLCAVYGAVIHITGTCLTTTMPGVAAARLPISTVVSQLHASIHLLPRAPVYPVLKVAHLLKNRLLGRLDHCSANNGNIIRLYKG